MDFSRIPGVRLSVLVGGCLAVAVAYAQSTGSSSSSPASAGFGIAFLIAYLSRKNPIGGWLLYFYLQLYGGALLGLLFLSNVAHNLNISNWESTSQYAWFFLSTVPVLLAQYAEIVVGTSLLILRNGRNLAILRLLLLVLGIASSTSLLIDLWKFNDGANVVFDVMTCGFAWIWFAYMKRSVRVRMVFVDRNWNYDGIAGPPQFTTSGERRYRAKRTLLVATVAFLAFFALMGLTGTDNAPTAELFGIPVFYSVLAAAFGWFLPLRKKTRDRLVATESLSLPPDVPRSEDLA